MSNIFTKKDFLLFILIIFSCVIINLAFKGCLYRFIFNINCPFCGATRVSISVLRLDFAKAFHYFPLFFLLPLYLYTFIKFINENRYVKSFIGLNLIFIIVYIIRVCYYKNIYFI